MTDNESERLIFELLVKDNVENSNGDRHQSWVMEDFMSVLYTSVTIYVPHMCGCAWFCQRFMASAFLIVSLWLIRGFKNLELSKSVIIGSQISPEIQKCLVYWRWPHLLVFFCVGDGDSNSCPLSCKASASSIMPKSSPEKRIFYPYIMLLYFSF